MTSAAILVPHRVVDAVGYQVDSRILLLVAAMALWGVSEGNGPVVESIFADSVPTGAQDGEVTAGSIPGRSQCLHSRVCSEPRVYFSNVPDQWNAFRLVELQPWPGFRLQVLKSEH